MGLFFLREFWISEKLISKIKFNFDENDFYWIDKLLVFGVRVYKGMWKIFLCLVNIVLVVVFYVYNFG